MSGEAVGVGDTRAASAVTRGRARLQFEMGGMLFETKIRGCFEILKAGKIAATCFRAPLYSDARGPIQFFRDISFWFRPSPTGHITDEHIQFCPTSV